MENRRNYLILHGHFYQPPREDPWTDEIETQDSAAPFHDWNERINRECYAANAASRVIDSFGRIQAILNNYEHISFNFGPTLVDWLLRHDPRTLERIVEADRHSAQRLEGHGNAIAQVYNHIILPLATDADKTTQIVWGLRHFEKTYGRRSEGIWLAETAVNDRTVEVLIEQGVKYIILAPTQAQAVQYEGQEEWTDVSHNNIDPSRAYRLETPAGQLAVFFYYGDIASKLSFEHLLFNVDHLRGELLAHDHPDQAPPMINVATDGESYGHHEPFGDMCLARLIYENREREDFFFGNYGHFLAHNPPRDRVRLKEGNNGLGTAWSCAHGVGRWFEDCGCQTGGAPDWKQQWRHPLRQAFDLLRDRVHRLAGEELRPWLHDVWKARNDYIEVAAAPDMKAREEALAAWLKSHLRKTPGDQDRLLIIRIMEALRQAMLMYTSCGWFFSEISGIETVQDMRYAARVLDLVEDMLPSDTREKFLHILEKAVSNIPAFVNGRRIFEDMVWAHQFDSRRVINQFLLEKILRNQDVSTGKTQYMYGHALKVTKADRITHTEWSVHKFQLELKDRLTGQQDAYLAYIISAGQEYTSFIKSYIDESLLTYLDKVCRQDNLRAVNRELRDWFRESFHILDMKYEVRRSILQDVSAPRLSELHRQVSEAQLDVEEFLSILKNYRDWQVSMDTQDILSIRNLLSNHIIQEMNHMLEKGIDKYDFSDLIRVILSARSSDLEIDVTEIAPLLQREVSLRIHSVVEQLDKKEIDKLDHLIDFANLAGLDFEKSEIQDAMYDRLISHQQGKRRMRTEEHSLLIRLADKFNLAVHQFEE